MDKQSLGKKLKGDEERDAIHVAIMPVVCDDPMMSPGQPVILVKGNMVRRASPGVEPMGIIDPFLKDNVQQGECCWMFLMPGTVTGMRHHWQHPVIDPGPKDEAEKWLRKFAAGWNFNYARMIEAAQQDGGYVVADGIDLHSREELDPGDEEMFWQHIETLTGKKFPQAHRLHFGWSCSC